MRIWPSAWHCRPPVAELTFDAGTKVGVDTERMKAEAPRSISYRSSGMGKPSYAHVFDKIQIGQSAYGDVELKVSDIKVEPYDGLLGLDFLRTRKAWCRTRPGSYW